MVVLAFLSDATTWVTEDPIGQKVAIGVLLVVALFALLMVMKTMRWAAARWKMLFGAAVVLAGLFYLGIWLFNLGPVGWIVAGVAAFGAFLGLALWAPNMGR